MAKIAVFLLVVCVCSAFSLPLEADINIGNAAPVQDMSPEARLEPHSVQRRYINPAFSVGAPGAGTTGLVAKIRAKRSYDECEKLQLCKLHARSGQNFFAAYELYFVNKENARLWDHRARSMAECEQRFGDCYYR